MTTSPSRATPASLALVVTELIKALFSSTDLIKAFSLSICFETAAVASSTESAFKAGVTAIAIPAF